MRIASRSDRGSDKKFSRVSSQGRGKRIEAIGLSRVVARVVAGVAMLLVARVARLSRTLNRQLPLL